MRFLYTISNDTELWKAGEEGNTCSAPIREKRLAASPHLIDHRVGALALFLEPVEHERLQPATERSDVHRPHEVAVLPAEGLQNSAQGYLSLALPQGSVDNGRQKLIDVE